MLLAYLATSNSINVLCLVSVFLCRVNILKCFNCAFNFQYKITLVAKIVPLVFYFEECTWFNFIFSGFSCSLLPIQTCYTSCFSFTHSSQPRSHSPSFFAARYVNYTTVTLHYFHSSSKVSKLYTVTFFEPTQLKCKPNPTPFLFCSKFANYTMVKLAFFYFFSCKFSKQNTLKHSTHCLVFSLNYNSTTITFSALNPILRSSYYNENTWEDIHTPKRLKLVFQCLIF